MKEAVIIPSCKSLFKDNNEDISLVPGIFSKCVVNNIVHMSSLLINPFMPGGNRRSCT